VVVALLGDLETALNRAAAQADVGAVAAQQAGAEAAGVIQRGLALGDEGVGVLRGWGSRGIRRTRRRWRR
jgi:predicted DNA repair protein MutK